jgi:alkylhydroperoxidase family enzyme
MTPRATGKLARRRWLRYYGEQELAGLIMSIATINAWNRLTVTIGQLTGEWES